MEEPDKTRQERGLPDCTVDGASGVWALPPGPPTAKCDPVIPVIPDDFVLPDAPIGNPDQPTGRPDLVTVFSRQTVVRCSDIADVGPHGDDVVVEAGAVDRSFSWASVPGISAHQLDYLSKLPGDQYAELIDPDTTSKLLMQAAGMTSVQAEFASADLVRLQVEADQAAVAIGIGTIACRWLSESVSASCPDGALESPFPDDTPFSPRNPVQLDFGYAESEISQEDADSSAEAEATTLLSCVYGNEEQTVLCPGDVPNLPELVTQDGITIPERVGTVTVQANLFFSQNSREEANERAVLFGQAQLRCLYPNQSTEVDCADEAINRPTAALIPGGSLHEQRAGNPVRLEYGAVVSPISQQDADASARSLALDLLNCGFVNGAVTVLCPPGDYGGVAVAASVKSPVPAITVEAGLFPSLVSQQDADDQAEVFARSQLRCVYCNPRINPTCVPPHIVSAFGGIDNVPVPIIPELQKVDPLNSDYRVDSRWAANFTPGVAADTICGDSPEIPIQLVNIIATTPGRVLDDCIAESDEIVVACYNGELSYYDSSGQLVTQTIYGLFPEADRELLSALSKPNPRAADPNARIIKISSGFQSVTENQVPDTFLPGETFRAKKYANYIALQFGMTFLECFFESDEQVVTCEEKFPGKTGFYTGPINGIRPVTSYTVAAGLERSYESKGDANSKARTLAMSLLTCIYSHDNVTGLCADSAVAPESLGSPVNPVTVLAATFTSDNNQDEVDAQVQSLIRASLDCFYNSIEMRIMCGAYAVNTTTIGSYGDGTMMNVYGDIRPVTPDSIGSSLNPVDLIRGYETSTTSQNQADMRAFLAGLGYLSCSFFEREFGGGQPRCCRPGEDPKTTGCIECEGKEGKDGEDGEDGEVGEKGDKGDKGDTGEVPCPWDAVVESGVFEFIRPGFCMGAGIPTNMFVGVDLWSAAVGAAETAYIKLVVTTSGNVATSCYITKSSTPADPIGIAVGNAPSSFEIDLWVVQNRIPYRVIHCGNISVVAVVGLTTSAATPTCNGDPYVRHYTWEVRA